MPENEFEKKVSSEMQDLRLKPSEKVWLQVEERIRKKKKRRVIVIIFFLAGIALLGYWQRHNLFGGSETGVAKIDASPDADQENSSRQNKTPANKQQAAPAAQTPETKNKNDGPDKKEQAVNEDDVEIAVKPGITSPPNTVGPTVKKIVSAGKERINNPVQEKKQTDESSSLIITQSEPGIKSKEKSDSAALKVETAETIKDGIKIPDVAVIENKIDSAKNEVSNIKKEDVPKKDTVAAKLPVLDSAVVINQQPKPRKKWKWGIELTPGISSLRDEIFSLNMNKSLADAYGGPQSGSGSGTPLPPSPPSESASSFAFQVGAFATKQLTKKSSVSVGLRYAYYSESINIGARYVPVSNNLSLFLASQGANQAFSVAGDPIPVTNRYHFIELPANYTLQLNRNKSYPLLWRVGFKIGTMIGSNALVYDTIAGGIYYKSEKYINKTQFGLSTGLNWTFVNKTRFQLGVGPVVDLQLSSLQDNPFEKNKYLFFIGLRSAIIFNNKK